MSMTEREQQVNTILRSAVDGPLDGDLLQAARGVAAHVEELREEARRLREAILHALAADQVGGTLTGTQRRILYAAIEGAR